MDFRNANIPDLYPQAHIPPSESYQRGYRIFKLLNKAAGSVDPIKALKVDISAQNGHPSASNRSNS
jgi:hypothetical protein